jgi:hypothetical protein
MSAVRSLPGVNRTWPGQPISVENDPKAVISHNASIARLYLGLLFSSAAEQVVLAAA